jgi:2-hydroxychromene-2-carboxylate isomerase
VKRKCPRFYFSFRSPYSWIGARLLEEKVETNCYGIDYIPSWEPDEQTSTLLEERGGEILYTSMSKQKHLYILQDIKRLTSKLGYKMAWPIDRNPWWDLPHLAYLAAQQYGKGHSFFWAVYRTRWEEGQDICSVHTIRRLAEEVGLAPDAIIGAVEEPIIRQMGAELLYQAYKDGVFGFPFFISSNSREKFWGIDRLEDFISSLQEKQLSI